MALPIEYADYGLPRSFGAEQKGIRCKAGAAATTVIDQKTHEKPIGPRPEKGCVIAGNRVVISQETCRRSAVTQFGVKCAAGSTQRVFAMAKARRGFAVRSRHCVGGFCLQPVRAC